MSKAVTLHLSESEYRELVLCYTLGNLVQESVKAKGKSEMDAQMELYQKLFKAAFDAKLKGSGYVNDLYYYGKEVEDEMLQIYEDFKLHVVSGDEGKDIWKN